MIRTTYARIYASQTISILHLAAGIRSAGQNVSDRLDVSANGMSERSNDRSVISKLSNLWKRTAEIHSENVRFHFPRHAAVRRRSIHVWIKRFDVTGATT